MKKLFISFLFLTIAITSFSGEIVLKGVYQGQNLFVMNPFSASGVGFCIYEVTVNENVTTDEINSSAFEIDLSVYQLKIGDKIIIKIKHKENCTPKVLNPEVIKPKSTFSLTSIKVDRKGILTWSTTKETGSLPYIVEQFRWNKWIKIAKINGKGSRGINNYSTKVRPHSGNNKFRIKQIDYTKKPRYSQEVNFRSLKPPVTFLPLKPTTEIVFSRETMYEIFDYYGNLILKGYKAKINISGLKKGDYFLNYDTKTGNFKKK